MPAIAICHKFSKAVAYFPNCPNPSAILSSPTYALETTDLLLCPILIRITVIHATFDACRFTFIGTGYLVII
jgi:hypothetical protein